MALSLLKPATVGATVNPPSGSTILKASSGTFTMKVWKMRCEHRVHSVAETTGDQDLDPRFEHNGLQNGFYTFIGAKISGSALGISALSGSSNPGPLKFILTGDGTSSTGDTHEATFLVERISADWEKTGVFMPVSVSGRITDTAESGIETNSPGS